MTERVEEGAHPFSVIDGGAAAPRLRALVVDLDMRVSGNRLKPVLHIAEAAALRMAMVEGLRLLVLTECETIQAEQLLVKHGITGAVIRVSQNAGSLGNEPFDSDAMRAHAVARWCQGLGIALRETVVIATCPSDMAAMAEAGLALALEDAGSDAMAAADAVFPPRRARGLVAALGFTRSFRNR